MSIEGWLAWSFAAAVSCVMFSRLRKLARVDKPSAQTLLAELAASEPEGAERPNATKLRAYRSLELDERLSEVQATARHDPELGLALSRASLACGTALSLLALIRDGTIATRTLHGVLAFAAGVVGAGVVSYLGRSARLQARDIREHWLRIVKETRGRLDQ